MNISQYFSLKGAVVLERLVKIPPPVLKENETEYLEELSKIKESEDWIKKHSVENESSINENKIMQNHHINDKQALLNFFEAIIEISVPIIFFLIILPILAIILFSIMLFFDFPSGIRSFPFG